MYSNIAANKRNTVIIMAVFLLLLAALGCIIGMRLDDYKITAIVIVVSIIYAVFEYFAASKMAMTIAGGREIQRSDNPYLWSIVENLAITDGLPMPRVFIIDDPAPNAFATGRDPQHAYVAATTGIIQLMDKRELTAVMAHEMSHVKNYDIRVNMIVFGLTAAIGMICDILIRLTWIGSDRDNKDSNAAFSLIGLIAAIVAPILAALIRLAVSRQREYLADASGTLTTRDPEALADALEKLKGNQQPMKNQNTAMAHLYFTNPLSKGSFGKLFSTHPPLDDRIARLRASVNKM